MRIATLGLLTLTLATSGCYTWGPTPLSPQELVSQESPSSILITHLDGSEEVVQEPQIIRDSIYATSASCRSSVAAGGRQVCEETATPVASLDEIQYVDVRRTKIAETFAVAVIVPVAAIYLLGLLVCC